MTNHTPSEKNCVFDLAGLRASTFRFLSKMTSLCKQICILVRNYIFIFFVISRELVVIFFCTKSTTPSCVCFQLIWKRSLGKINPPYMLQKILCAHKDTKRSSPKININEIVLYFSMTLFLD